MKAYIFLLALAGCLYAHVECRPQTSTDFSTEKREFQELSQSIYPLRSGSKKVGDVHVEARGFAWLHVSPEQSHLERTVRDLVFKAASASSEPTGEKVKGGYDVAHSQFYRLCQASYAGGVHPGKYFKNTEGYVCHIGYGGKEIQLKTFSALINTCSDKTSSVWVPYPPTNSGSTSVTLPTGILQAGHEGTRKLYFCRAWHQDAYNPGKILVDSGSTGPYKCNFSWGGAELEATKFQVLVDTCGNANNGKK